MVGWLVGCAFDGGWWLEWLPSISTAAAVESVKESDWDLISVTRP